MDKVIVTRRGFLARMQRHFKKQGMNLRHGAHQADTLGEFYLIDATSIVEKRITYRDLVLMARDAGVLRPFEAVEDAV